MTTEPRPPDHGWWMWIPAHAITCSLTLVIVADGARRAVEPISPAVADYGSRALVLIGLLIGSWFAEPTCKAFTRWLRAR